MELFVWGTLALINAGLAQGKGRSGLVWFLVSLFLGPIATFLIVFLNPVEMWSEGKEEMLDEGEKTVDG